MAKYSDDYRVRVGDADSCGFLKLPSLLGMMQEIAKDHAEALEIGASVLAPQGLGWALSKLQLEISRLPNCGERVFIKTWASTRSKIHTEREFLIFDDLGDKIASARSMWILFDLKKRRIERLVKLPNWMRDEEFANDFTFSEISKAPSADSPFVSNFGVRKDDIDMNGHVNNSIYLTWALEPVPDDFYSSHKARKVEIYYLSEVFRGQRLDSICELDGNLSRHLIVSEGRERARAQIEWIEA